jgi:hypothetical protein
MPKQKRKHDFSGSRSIPKRNMPRSKSASPKQRKQLAHNAPCPTGCGQISRMITAQWNVVIQPRVLASLTRSGQKGRPRDKRSPYEGPVIQYETNRPTKQRDLFQAA